MICGVRTDIMSSLMFGIPKALNTTCGYPQCNGFAQVRIENLVPGLLHAQSKTPSKYRFTIVSLIVPVYPYSCGFRALIEAIN